MVSPIVSTRDIANPSSAARSNLDLLRSEVVRARAVLDQRRHRVHKGHGQLILSCEIQLGEDLEGLADTYRGL